jgi:hypothetical protein
MNMISERTSKFMLSRIMTKQVGNFVLLLVVCALVTGCKSSQTLSYDVLLRHVSLETEPGSEKAPNMIVITSKDEIVPPAKGIKYPTTVFDLLSTLDYNKSIAILFLGGQIQKDSKINKIIREGDSVTIELNDYSIGPGNYEVQDFTLPYQLIAIEKTGTWGDSIHFGIRANQTDIVAEVDHFVP